MDKVFLPLSKETSTRPSPSIINVSLFFEAVAVTPPLFICLKIFCSDPLSVFSIVNPLTFTPFFASKATTPLTPWTLLTKLEALTVPLPKSTSTPSPVTSPPKVKAPSISTSLLLSFPLITVGRLISRKRFSSPIVRPNTLDSALS